MLEMTSIGCAFITSIVLLFFSTERYSHGAAISVILFILAVLSALMFFGFWIYGFSHWVWDAVNEKFPDEVARFMRKWKNYRAKKQPPSAV